MEKHLKKLILVFTVLFSLSLIYAQEAEATTEAATETPAEKKNTVDFVMQFEPGFYINTASTMVSAPSPIVYPISIGFLVPNYTQFAAQPSVSFFMMNHLLYDNKALPAEIENRTTTTLSFMINLPAVYSVYLDNSRFQFTAGLGVFLRFGILSPGVSESDSGWTGSAGKDAAAINNLFWGNMRWLYTTAGVSWLYNLTDRHRAGPTLNIYIPVGGLIADQDLQGMIISAGIKICR